MATVVRSPHFSLPLRFLRGGCPVLEQDSTEEIQQCGEIALRYERGQRTGLPDFGVPDQAMLQGGANLVEITAAVTQHDTRVAASADREQIIKRGVDKVRVTIGGNRNG